mmetsp:Transcript_27297/g.31161  ORF Transcript_27297/g.31161 Transcript_27297/m.31161 type:complete len:249 (-) Transcript_27297:127-873(-)
MASDNNGGIDFNRLSSIKAKDDKDILKVRCDKYIKRGLARDKTVQFLLERLKSMGCNPPEGFIRCVDCGKLAGGGFGLVEETALVQHDNENTKNRAAPSQCQPSMNDLHKLFQAQKEGKSILTLKPEIYLCQQYLQSESHARQSMIHELVHAIDMCRTKMDPLNNCIHMACTEIRAQNLSGECQPWKEFIGGQISKFPKHGQVCVKRRAALSVRENPNCHDRVEEYINAAFDRCFEDTFPFDRHPSIK